MAPTSLIEEICYRAEVSLGELRQTIEQMNVAVEDLYLDLPPTEVNGGAPDPLVSSDMALIEAIGILRGRKDYKNGGGA